MKVITWKQTPYDDCTVSKFTKANLMKDNQKILKLYCTFVKYNRTFGALRECLVQLGNGLSASKAPWGNAEPFGKQSQWAFDWKLAIGMLKAQSWSRPILGFQHLANTEINFFAPKLPSLILAYSGFAILLLFIFCVRMAHTGSGQWGCTTQATAAWDCMVAQVLPAWVEWPLRPAAPRWSRDPKRRPSVTDLALRGSSDLGR